MKKGSPLQSLTLLFLRTLANPNLNPNPISSRARVTLPPADPDGLQSVEDQVRAKIADRLRGPPAAVLPTTDDESDPDDQARALERKKPKGVSDKLRTADSTVVH